MIKLSDVVKDDVVENLNMLNLVTQVNNTDTNKMFFTTRYQTEKSEIIERISKQILFVQRTVYYTERAQLENKNLLQPILLKRQIIMLKLMK